MDKACTRVGPVYLCRKRWLEVRDGYRRLAVPYIDKRGCIWPSPMAEAKMLPQQLFKSLVSAVYIKMLKRTKANNYKFRRLSKSRLLMACALSVIKHRVGVLDRVTAMLVRGRSPAGYIYHLLRTTDEQNRFLIDQVLHRASWFKLRGGRGRPSDKSVFVRPGSDPPKRGATGRLLSLLCQWSEPYVVT